MAPRPEEQPATLAHPGAPVKLEDQQHDRVPQVPAGWLEREHLTQAEQVDRLAADYDLVTTLALRRFEGAEYDYFANELAKYGMAVISGWMRRGVILARCRERGFGGLQEPPIGAFDDPDVVVELACETVAVALVHFRTDVLMTRKWDYRRGAALRTFFVGQCLIRYANVYRRWLKHESRRPHAVTDHDTLDALERRQVPSVEDLVMNRAQVDRALRAVREPRVRQVLVLHATGLTYTEIGRRLGVTAKTVERMIANERTRMARRGIA